MTNETKYKPTLCIDFDGVIHSYENGWQGGKIYGSMMPGFPEWAAAAGEHFMLVVYSSRSGDPELRDAMAEWIREKFQAWWQANGEGCIHPEPTFIFAHEKPAAFLTIDDRAVLFRGSWWAAELDPHALLAFKPWTARL